MKECTLCGVAMKHERKWVPGIMCIYCEDLVHKIANKFALFRLQTCYWCCATCSTFANTPTERDSHLAQGHAVLKGSRGRETEIKLDKMTYKQALLKNLARS